MYQWSQGVRPDNSAAVSWFRKAADQGLAAAQLVSKGGGSRLCHRSTQSRAHVRERVGVPQNYVTRHMWFNLAAAAGYNDGASSRDSLAAQMTQAQIAEAQRLTDQWRLNRTRRNPAQVAIPLQLEGGTFTVPVSINDKLTINFVLDSGACQHSHLQGNRQKGRGLVWTWRSTCPAINNTKAMTSDITAA